MKKLLFNLVIAFAILTSISSVNSGDPNLMLANGIGISVYLSDSNQHKMFLNAEYSNEYEFLLLETKSQMNYIQIFNRKGTIEKTITVDAYDVQIKKEIFNKGEYLMGLKFDNRDTLEFVSVILNQ